MSTELQQAVQQLSSRIICDWEIFAVKDLKIEKEDVETLSQCLTVTPSGVLVQGVLAFQHILPVSVIMTCKLNIQVLLICVSSVLGLQTYVRWMLCINEKDNCNFSKRVLLISFTTRW